ncbi:MAG: hypothetical protein E7047_09695 [Lentisphaerae bacterium]|nr:hypothetical protein [Lentisphaerota bacterium]
MAEFENFVELGDFLIEFQGQYLGNGKCAWSMTPSGLDLRRDEWMLPSARQLKAIKWKIAIELTGADRFWALIAPQGELGMSQFYDHIFSYGADLKLFPLDPHRAGFKFERVYLEDLTQKSGSYTVSGTLKLLFSAVAAPENNNYLTRIAPGELPQQADLKQERIDLDTLSRALVDKLAFLLKVVPGQGINLNGFAGDKEGAFALNFDGCANWQYGAARQFDYTLSARFPCGQKVRIDRLFCQIAGWMQTTPFELENSDPLVCQIKSLKSDTFKMVNNQRCFESHLSFTLLSY